MFLRPRSPRATRVRALLDDQVSQRLPLCITRFNLAELYVGLQLSKRPEIEAPMIRRIATSFRVLEFDDACAWMFARSEAAVRRLGTPIERLDLLIASVALANAMPIVTANTMDFERVPGLSVLSY